MARVPDWSNMVKLQLGHTRFRQDVVQRGKNAKLRLKGSNT